MYIHIHIYSPMWFFAVALGTASKVDAMSTLATSVWSCCSGQWEALLGSLHLAFIASLHLALMQNSYIFLRLPKGFCAEVKKNLR